MFSDNEKNLIKNNLEEIIKTEQLNENNKMILFYHPSYYKNIIVKIKEENNLKSKINFSEIVNIENKEKGNIFLYGRIFHQENENLFLTNNTIIFYIGNEDDELITELSLRFKSKIKEIYVIGKNNGFKNEKLISSNRIITRRFNLINQIKNYETFGILIGNIELKNLKESIYIIKKTLKDNNRKVYTILLGKITDEKLCNFVEFIDCFILFACPFNEGYSKKVLDKPIVSPLDIQFAFDSQYKWDSTYSFDINYIIEKEKLNIDIKKSKENNTSLLNKNEENKLQIKDYKTQALVNIFSYQIIERYDKRKFKGLSDEGLEDEPVHKVIMGKRGIPIKYEKIKE